MVFGRWVWAVFGLVAACSTSEQASHPDGLVGRPPEAATQSAPSRIVIETVQPPAAVGTRSREEPRLGSSSTGRITLDVRDADVHNVLRLLAEQGGMNIVVDARVQGRVTMRLENVTVEDAFVAVLDSLSLGWTSRGSITVIGP